MISEGGVPNTALLATLPQYQGSQVVVIGSRICPQGEAMCLQLRGTPCELFTISGYIGYIPQYERRSQDSEYLRADPGIRPEGIPESPQTSPFLRFRTR